MPNDKGMTDDKKARLEAIRAANAAKKAQGGGEAEPVTVAAVQAPVAAAPVASATPAAGANMSDEKKAKLEAIRAANAAKKADAGAAAPAVVATTTPTAPATATAAAPAVARPAAARPAPKSTVLEDDRVPIQIYLRRAVVGAVLGLILCLLLATMTGNYVAGALWGLVLGALAGLLILNWPPEHTTGD